MVDKENAPRRTDSLPVPDSTIREEALSVSGIHDLQISDPKKRDSVAAFSQCAIIMLSFIYAIMAFYAHLDSARHGYKWEITQWELAVIFTPLGGGTIWSWVVGKFKK